MRTRYREITDEEEGEIVVDILLGLDPEDILSIPGLRQFIAINYADDIAERWDERLTAYAEEAAEMRWRQAAE